MKKSRHSIGHLALWLVLLACIFGLVAFLFNPSGFQMIAADIGGMLGIASPQDAGNTPSPAVLGASQLAENGDLSGASLAAQQANANGATSPADIFGAQLLQDAANAAAASTSQSSLASLQTMIQDYHEAAASSTPFYAAWTLNAVVRALLRGDAILGDDVLVSQISDDPTLSSYAVTGDFYATVSNLARYSYSIYPTSDAAYNAAAASQQYILANYTDAGDPSVAAKLANAQADIQNWLAQGDSALAVQSQNNASDVLGIAEVPLTTLTRASLLSTISLIDKSDWPEAQAAYQSIYDYYTNTLDSQGNQYPILLQPVASGHLLQAFYLYQLDPQGNAAQIASNLQAFVSAFNADPSLEEGLVGSINSLTIAQQGKAAVTSAYGSQAWSSFQRAYTMYLYFAKVSPVFKTFLQSEGWKLPQ